MSKDRFLTIKLNIHNKFFVIERINFEIMFFFFKKRALILTIDLFEFFKALNVNIKRSTSKNCLISSWIWFKFVKAFKFNNNWSISRNCCKKTFSFRNNAHASNVCVQKRKVFICNVFMKTQNHFRSFLINFLFLS